MADPKFGRLVRFLSTSGTIHMGEVPSSHPWTKDLAGLEVPIYDGTLPWDDNLKLTTQKAVVKEVLSPFSSLPFIYGVGLNYRKHAEEGGVSLPRDNASPHLELLTNMRFMTGPHSNIPKDICEISR